MQDDGFFDAEVAATYDAVHGAPSDASIPQVVARLHELAAGGAALEFAIGTGRIALPLQTSGTKVAGIELSQAMVAELRKKETGAPMDIAIGDMTTTQVTGDFNLVFLVFNTIDNLTTQDAQIACFQNAFDHLQPGGCFVVETLVPPIQKLPAGQTLLANDCTDAHWGIDEFDVVMQTYTSHHIRPIDGQDRRLSIPFRYCWPAEMDVMAKMAGFVPEVRWADWDMSPFTRNSTSHVSVWRKPGGH